MFYAYLVMLWFAALWGAGSGSDLLFYANNYESFPGASVVMVPGLILIWALFGLISNKLIKIARRHYQKVQEKKAAVMAAPTAHVAHSGE